MRNLGLTAIGNGNGAQYFPEKYFPKDQMTAVLNGLVTQCDFKNRNGKFINDYYEADNAGGDRISELYEFHMSCGDLRIVFTYRIAGEDIELIKLKLEPTTTENSMILSPRRKG